MQKIERILDNHNLPYSTILTSDSGFSNKVYITDQHVVKLFTDRKRYDKEYWFYTNVGSDYTATMIASKYYPELFSFEGHSNRMKLYSLEYDLALLKEYPENMNLRQRIDEDLS